MDMPCTAGASYYILADWFPADCTSGASYFHPCSTDNGAPNAGAPENIWGSQSAQDGVAYGGTLTYSAGLPFPPRDYASALLMQPLVAGTEYCFSLYASLAGRSMYRSATLNAVFTTYYPTACSGNDTLNWPTEAQLAFDLTAWIP
ncbi:MAG: hypothetical protein IPL52_05155 [Flavobacteriales bacterium]|nr:hypothetical protein [Flavobacteriales bacterium]